MGLRPQTPPNKKKIRTTLGDLFVKFITFGAANVQQRTRSWPLVCILHWCSRGLGGRQLPRDKAGGLGGSGSTLPRRWRKYIITYIGGWGSESFRTPNREIVFRVRVRAVRACVRSCVHESSSGPGAGAKPVSSSAPALAGARIPAASRLRPGCVPTASRLCPGCVPAASRLRPGCVPAASRLHPGCVPAASRLQ